MAAGCSELERAACTLLTPDIREIRRSASLPMPVRRDVRRRSAPVAEIADGLGEMAQRNRFDSCERSLRRGLGRAQDSLEPKPFGSFGDRENSSDGPAGVHRARALRRPRAHGETSASIWPEAARIARAMDRSKADPSLRRPAGARLTTTRPGGHAQLGRGNSAADSLLRFLAGAIGQPDDRQGGLSFRKVGFDLDAARFEPDERMSDRASEHSLDGRRRARAEVCRLELEGVRKSNDFAAVDSDDVERDLRGPSGWAAPQATGTPPRRSRRCFSTFTISTGCAEVEPGTHLDLTEDDARAAADDQIDLASPDPCIRARGCGTPGRGSSGERGARRRGRASRWLARRARELLLRRGSTAPETSGGESRTVRVHAPWRSERA